MLVVLIAAATTVGLLLGARLRVLVFRHGAAAGDPDRTGCPSCGRELVPPGGSLRALCPRGRWLPVTGRCPGCASRVGPPYALLELLTGAGFGLLAWRFPDLRLPVLLAGCAIGIALSAIDLAVHRLPDRISLAGYPLLGTLIAVSLTLGDGAAPVRAALGVLGYAGFLMIFSLPPGGIGFGDVKLAGWLGGVLAWVDWPVLLRGMLLALVLAGAAAVGLLVSRRAGRRFQLPLGPFLVTGALLALLSAGGTG